MSRLPGGIFVGVVTLLCGLGFAQFEFAPHTGMPEELPVTAKSKLEKPVQKDQPKVPDEQDQKLAAEVRAKS